jgi:DHA2 family multidrug resistance protein
MQATLVHNSSVMHSTLAAQASVDNPIFRMIPAFNLDTVQGRIALDAEMLKQSLMIGYLDDFMLSVFLSLLAVPLAFMLQKPSKTASQERVEVHVE